MGSRGWDVLVKNTPGITANWALNAETILLQSLVQALHQRVGYSGANKWKLASCNQRLHQPVQLLELRVCEEQGWEIFRDPALTALGEIQAQFDALPSLRRTGAAGVWIETRMEEAKHDVGKLVLMTANWRCRRRPGATRAGAPLPPGRTARRVHGVLAGAAVEQHQRHFAPAEFGHLFVGQAGGADGAVDLVLPHVAEDPADIGFAFQGEQQQALALAGDLLAQVGQHLRIVQIGQVGNDDGHQA